MSRSTKSTITKDADHIYYDMVISHNDSVSVGGSPTDAVYSETRGEAILDKPSDYYLAIDRFSIPGLEIPIFIFTPDAYSVAMDFNGNESGQKFVQFISDSSYDSSHPFFYYIFSYQLFITMINKALATAFAALPAKPAGVTAPPYLIYDESSSTFSMIAQQTYTPVSATLDSPLNLRVYFNTPLYNFFQNFYTFFHGYAQTDGKDFHILLTNTYNNNILIPFGAPGYDALATLPNAYVNKQEFSSLYLWNAFKDIVITSGALPTALELVPTLNSNGTVVQGRKDSRKILSDFFPLIDLGPEVRSSFQYNASGKYRYIDLISDSPLFTMDLQFYWEDNFLNLYPILIPAHDIINIKIAFIKKNKIGNITTN